MALKILGGPLRLGGRGGLQIKTGGAAVFTPASVANLQAWFDATKITPVADGTAIASWADSSTNARNATQATGSKQPLYKTAIQNGKPVVRFDGVDDWLHTAAFTLNQPITLLAVGVFNNANTNVYMCDGGGDFRSAIVRISSTAVGLFGGSTNSCSTTTTPTAWHQYTGILNGASSTMSVDGGSGTTGNPGSTAAGGFSMGASGGAGPSAFAQVDIGEMLVYSGVVSAPDQAALRAYLKAKWGTP